MRTNFWRFSYDEIDISSAIESNRLPFPDLSRWPVSKNNSKKKISDEIKVNDFILLANFDRLSEIGVAKKIGKVISKDGGEFSIHWKKIVPSLSLTPDIQGGVNVWLTEGVFCFDSEPVKRYKLNEHANKLFA